MLAQGINSASEDMEKDKEVRSRNRDKRFYDSFPLLILP